MQSSLHNTSSSPYFFIFYFLFLHLRNGRFEMSDRKLSSLSILFQHRKNLLGPRSLAHAAPFEAV